MTDTLCTSEFVFYGGTGGSCSRDYGHAGAHYSTLRTRRKHIFLTWFRDRADLTEVITELQERGR